ncbi:unnamed protein product, partial [Echinostoma caproni]|uniref:Reverse transcriptase domain-containing protein n=1 Tax=Echinostoma caproni TaxID=27848 RepID=A0A183AFR9_9TREM
MKAISGYHVWLYHALIIPPSPKSPSFLNPKASDPLAVCNQFASQLLQFAPCLHLSNPISLAEFNFAHRHMCSPLLLSRSFDLVRCAPSTEAADKNGDTLTQSEPTILSSGQSERFSRHSITSPCTSESEGDLDMVSRNTDSSFESIEHTIYLKCTWPILYASLLASAVDAVRSLWPLFHTGSVRQISKHDGSDSDKNGKCRPDSTPEVELCVAGLETLTKNIQESKGSYLLTAVQSGLLPFLYNMAWVLETALVRYEDRLAQADCLGLGPHVLIPLVTTLSRLMARVTHALLSHPSSGSNEMAGTDDLMFSTVTQFIRHLFVLSPGSNVSSSAADQAQTDDRENQSNAVARVEELFKQFTWAVDFTVDMLTYSETEYNPVLQFFRVFDPHASHTRVLDIRAFEWLHAYPRQQHPALSQQGSARSETSRSRSVQRATHRNQPAHTTGFSRSRSASRDATATSSSVTWNKPTSGFNPFAGFQQSLDQALITSLFTTGSHIQNGTLLQIPKKVKCINSSDCLTMICRALARLLVARTQPPVADAAIDPFTTYLLKLSNEEPWLLRACLNSLPRLFSSVFWSNLVDLENWLLSLMASESILLDGNTSLTTGSVIISSTRFVSDATSSSVTPVRSSSLTELSHKHTTGLILRQLEQLFLTVRSLLSFGLTSLIPDQLELSKQATSARVDNSDASVRAALTKPEVFRHRDLLILAEAKAKERWLAALPKPPNDRSDVIRGKSAVVAVPANKSSLPMIIDLLLPSFGTSSEPPVFRSSSAASQSPMLRSNKATIPAPPSSSRRRHSAKHLATLAHRFCVDGHNAWVTAAEERRRISGPLGIILWSRLADRVAHSRALFYDPNSAPGILCVDPVEGPMRQRRRMFQIHLPLADRLMLPEKQTFLAHRRTRHPIAALIGLPDHVDHPPDRRACNWSQLPLYLPLPASPLVQLASAGRRDVQGIWACSLVGLLHIPPVEGDLILGQSWLRFQPESASREDSASCAFGLGSGVRQGCPLSQTLLNCAVDWIMGRSVEEYQGVQFSPNLWLADLEFVDDIVVFGEDMSNLQGIVDHISRQASEISLKVNTSKTKTFATVPIHPENTLLLNGEPIESVESFKYLGSTILPNGQAKDGMQ